MVHCTVPHSTEFHSVKGSHWCGHCTCSRHVSLHHFRRSHVLLLLHHFMLVSVFIPVPVISGKGHYISGRIALAECSNIFLAIRWLIRNSGRRDGVLDACNSLALMASWWVSRVWVFPSIYMEFAQSRGLSLVDAVLTLPWHCNVGSVVVLAPQLWWFSLMVKTLRNFIVGAVAKSKDL
eukprot:m.185754 g.185754  ORF g.185754 m.185754 type:complete len:179 (-) comp24745_c0_seq2:242-778(-)